MTFAESQNDPYLCGHRDSTEPDAPPHSPFFAGDDHDLYVTGWQDGRDDAKLPPSPPPAPKPAQMNGRRPMSPSESGRIGGLATQQFLRSQDRAASLKRHQEWTRERMPTDA